MDSIHFSSLDCNTLCTYKQHYRNSLNRYLVIIIKKHGGLPNHNVNTAEQIQKSKITPQKIFKFGYSVNCYLTWFGSRYTVEPNALIPDKKLKNKIFINIIRTLTFFY